MPVDIAIITALEDQYEAVLRQLKRVRQITISASTWIAGEVDAPGVQTPYTSWWRRRRALGR